MSGAARTGPTSADMTSPSRCLLQYLPDHLSQRNAEFTKLDDKHIQSEKFVTFLEARLADIEFQLAAYCLDCNVFQATNYDLLKSQVPIEKSYQPCAAGALNSGLNFKLLVLPPSILLTQYVTRTAIKHCYNLVQFRFKGSELAMPVLYGVLEVVKRLLSTALVIC